MATIWARSAGNWNGSIWDYFNEDTQQIEAYPFASPQVNDIVYSNTFEISNVPDTISVSELHNDANDEYGIIDGGYFAHPSNSNVKTLSAKIYCGVNSFILRTTPSNSQGAQLYINGDIHTINSNCVIAYRSGVSRTHNLIVTGNIYCEPNCCLFSSEYGTYRVTITGNMICENGTAFLYNGSTNNNALTSFTFSGNLTNIIYSTITQTITSCNGNGKWQILINQAITTLNILGKLIAKNNAIFNGNSLTINGTIEFENTVNQSGIRFNNFNISNPDTFTWKDISEPRSNPFIILTNAEMNNRQQYPAEDVVKEGVEYVWGEKVGTYQQPPESVVLKDYEYDTIIAEENDIATYNAVRYIYADYGTLHWFELKTTTTDIVTDPTLQSITIDGETVVADTDYVVEYNDVCYQWSGSAWGSITTKNIGTVKTDIVTNPTETTLAVKKGILDVPSTQAIVTAINQSTIATNVNTLLQRLSDGLTQRLGQSVTIPILQQILDAHLN